MLQIAASSVPAVVPQMMRAQELTQTLHSLSEVFEELVADPSSGAERKAWLYETSKDALSKCEGQRAVMMGDKSHLNQAESRLVQAMARMQIREHRDRIQGQLKQGGFFSFFRLH